MAGSIESNDWVLVTGASSGIGADLARAFAREGRALVLCARSQEALDALAGELRREHRVQVRVVPADLSRPGAARGLRERLAADGVVVDVLVNNAGFGLRGPFLELDAVRQSEMIQLNVVALTELSRELAPSMKARGRGRILNVASTAAFQPGPSMAVYCATKAYVLSFSEALAKELEGTGVTVTCLCPGPTETAFAAAAGVTRTRLFKASRPMSSREVAERAQAALARGTALVVPGLKNRLLAASVRLVPVGTAARIARRLLEEH